MKKLSRYLSLILRHKPEQANIILDANGWIEVDRLLEGLKPQFNVTKVDLIEVVNTNEKKRFEFNSDMTKIRACQGHSVNVDLQLQSTQPPRVLFHGTNTEAIKGIKKEGIIKMSRNHVHLSEEISTAIEVGVRHKGKLVVLLICALKMYEEGYQFYRSNNGVWLTDNVPTQYLNLDSLLIIEDD